MRLDPVVNPIVNVTKKATSWIPGVNYDDDATSPGASESSPLIDRSADAGATGSPTNQDDPSASTLNFSHEYHPFQESKKVLIICAIHVFLYLAIAVGAYGFFFEQWGVVDSIYFAVVTFTTIGYGDLSPSTDAGRLFTIFFAIYGIGILGAFLSIIGNAIIETGHKAMAETEEKAKKRVLSMFSTSNDSHDEDKSKTFCRQLCLTTVLELPLIALLLILTILLGLPAGRSIISSIYFAVITATTIGFGDFHPQTTGMRALYIFYLPFSVAVFGQVLSKIASVYMDMKAQEADDKFLQRQLALRDLKAMDVDKDGKVEYGEFLAFILVALRKVDQQDIDEIRALFCSLDVDNNGYLEKSDLVQLTTSGDTNMQLTDSIRRMGMNAALHQ